MNILNFVHIHKKQIAKQALLLLATLILVSGLSFFGIQKENSFKTQVLSFANREEELKSKLTSISKELDDLKNQDQVKRNDQLSKEVKQINETYKKSATVYESILDLKANGKKYDELDKLYAASIKFLSEKNYASASAYLSEIEKKIAAEKTTVATNFKAPANLPVSNTPPSSGSFNRQSVQTSQGTFMVDIISADLNNNKVIIDTASDSDCKDNCPVMSLSEYVSRSSAWAGINGSFFCPSTYPTCVGKTNSFDTLIMNKNKNYFNSGNNVYSTIPAAIFRSGGARFVSQTLQWGRDTSVDAVIANYPLYTQGGQNVFSGSADAKITSKSPRTFIGATGSTAYIGIVYNASASEAAEVLKTLGIQDSLGMDQGGSTALWHGGYKAGPGRAIPNAVLFVRR